MAYNYPPYNGFVQQPLQQMTPQQIQMQQQLQQQIQQMQQSMPQPVQQPVQQPAQPQIQNGGFVSVQSRKEALDYPIAPGNSVTFIDAPNKRCYIKTKDYSPFKEPSFEVYKLVHEDAPKQAENLPENTEQEKAAPIPQYAPKEEIEALSARIDALKKKVNNTIERVDALSDRIDLLAAKKAPAKTKKEEDDDE